jgi:hypothetical protein
MDPANPDKVVTISEAIRERGWGIGSPDLASQNTLSRILGMIRRHRESVPVQIELENGDQTVNDSPSSPLQPLFRSGDLHFHGVLPWRG